MKIMINKRDERVVEIVELQKITVCPEEWDEAGMYYMIKEINVGFNKDQYTSVIRSIMDDTICITVGTYKDHHYVVDIM